MPFCRTCGSPVEGQFCAKCGTPAAAPAGAAPPPQPPPAQPYAQPYAQPGYGAPAPAAAGGLTDNVAGLLCYIAGLITGILFLVIEPYNRNKLIRFHAFQSIFLNIAWIALSIVMSIFSGIFFRALPWGMFGVLHLLFGLVWFVIWCGGLALWILLMVKAYQGQKFMLPIIGPLADKQA